VGLRALIIVAAVGLVPVSARGQGDPAGRGTRLEVSLALASVAVLDQTASPVPYGGVEPTLQIGYAALGARSRLAIRVGAAAATLSSNLTEGDLPREEEFRGWVEGEYLRRLRSGPARTSWFVGGALAVRGNRRRHYYAGPTFREESYGFGSVALAPVVAVERRLSSGATVSARLGVTVLGLVVRPYGALRVLSGSSIPLRIAGPDRLQGADFAFAYAQSAGRRVSLTWGYRLLIERLADAQPFRSATQSASLTVAFRLGSGS
jgi:hypothetical protein